MQPKKKDMVDTIISALRVYELEMIIPTDEKDTNYTIAEKINTIFTSMPNEKLRPMYNAAKTRLKYNNIGLIS
jgi:hypothetical protein